MNNVLNGESGVGSRKRRFQLVTDLHLLLIRDGKILLGKRTNTGYGDGAYHPPSGHLEERESLVEGLIRETREEIGITVEPQDAVFGHVMHNVADGSRIAFFFAVSKWKGEPINMEPEKCSELRWFPLDQLPGEMIDYARLAIKYYGDGERFSTYGGL